MLLFSLAAALLCAAAAGFVLWRAARAAAAPAEPPEAAVYARQLAELDAQKGQGLLDEDGWRAARAEAGRRLLRAAKDGPAQAEGPGDARDRLLVVGVAVAAVLAGGLVYLSVGMPGRPDAPFAPRLAKWSAAAERTPQALAPAQWAAVLEPIARKAPNNAFLLSYLARAYADAGEFAPAEGAFEKLTRLSPSDARAWAGLGEVRLAEADGRLDDRARAAFAHALKLDPHSPAALWWLGRDDVLAGRRDQGVAEWKLAAEALPANDPQRTDLETAIAQAEGGTFGQAQAVAQAAPAQQLAMIRGMVAGLAARLKSGRGSPEEWERLVRAYSVLGESEKRDQALARARALYAGRPEVLKALAAAAGPPQAAP